MQIFIKFFLLKSVNLLYLLSYQIAFCLLFCTILTLQSYKMFHK